MSIKTKISKIYLEIKHFLKTKLFENLKNEGQLPIVWYTFLLSLGLVSLVTAYTRYLIHAELRNTQCFTFCPFLTNKHDHSSITSMHIHTCRLWWRDWVHSLVSGFTPIMYIKSIFGSKTLTYFFPQENNKHKLHRLLNICKFSSSPQRLPVLPSSPFSLFLLFFFFSIDFWLVRFVKLWQ